MIPERLATLNDELLNVALHTTSIPSISVLANAVDIRNKDNFRNSHNTSDSNFTALYSPAPNGLLNQSKKFVNRKKFNLDDFQIIKMIGKGSFG